MNSSEAAKSKSPKELAGASVWINEPYDTVVNGQILPAEVPVRFNVKGRYTLAFADPKITLDVYIEDVNGNPGPPQRYDCYLDSSDPSDPYKWYSTVDISAAPPPKGTSILLKATIELGTPYPTYYRGVKYAG